MPGSEHDDRQEFEARKIEMAAKMATDHTLLQRARDVSFDADVYEWTYQWNWLGLPVIQMPTDIIAMQELIWETKPQLIVETGIARGGSLALYATVLQIIGEGTVIGIDIDLRPHNRQALTSHPLAHRFRLIDGSSTDPTVVQQVRELAQDCERVMVVLDSNHTHEHVLAELEAYGSLVSPGQYLVVADTAIDEIPVQAHRPRPWAPGNSPLSAVNEWRTRHPEFDVDKVLEDKLLISSSRGGYLVRKQLT
jgi:cephalosporin hydroxylase